MTKSAEIAALDKFIAQLGTDSYLGPWLADNRIGIVADITSDCAIDLVLPGRARHEARGLLESAREDATQIRAQAQADAAALRSQAQRQCDQQRQIIADLIRRHAEEAARALARL